MCDEVFGSEAIVHIAITASHMHDKIATKFTIRKFCGENSVGLIQSFGFKFNFRVN